MNRGDNPWLHIPLGDYEAHMALPQVAQSQLLAEIFSAQLQRYKPRSVAVLGCAGGNGFERIDPAITERVIGVDLNASYLQQARARYASRFATLELIEADLQFAAVSFTPVDMIYAALILEYLNLEQAFAYFAQALNRAGMLVTVVQLPGCSLPAITPSPYTALASLSAVMHFVAPAQLRDCARLHGLHEVQCMKHSSNAAKQFAMQVFQFR